MAEVCGESNMLNIGNIRSDENRTGAVFGVAEASTPEVDRMSAPR
jgi:hypothetical protein